MQQDAHINCWRYLLFPESFNRVGIHLGILANEGEGMVNCLGDENTIKWIAMMEGQGKVYFQIFEGDRKLDNTRVCEVGFERIEGESEGELTNVGFDGNFPKGGNTDEDNGGGFDLSAGGGGSRVSFSRNQMRVCVSRRCVIVTYNL